MGESEESPMNPSPTPLVPQTVTVYYVKKGGGNFELNTKVLVAEFFLSSLSQEKATLTVSDLSTSFLILKTGKRKAYFDAQCEKDARSDNLCVVRRKGN